MSTGLRREDIRALLDDLSAEQRFYSSDSLIVDVASPRYLLAMKLFAARAEIDADDIILLYRNLGFTTVDEGLDLVEQAYPGRPVPAKVKFLLTEIVGFDTALKPTMSKRRGPDVCMTTARRGCDNDTGCIG
jgi:hypothetical protein